MTKSFRLSLTPNPLINIEIELRYWKSLVAPQWIDSGNCAWIIDWRKMLQNLDSDKKIKMVASDAFENLLKQVQSSNLNFRMEISPFSPVITLKKSLLKDKSGQILFPPISESVQLQQSQDDQNCLLQKMKHLENIIEAQKSDYINALIQCKTAARHEFENELEIVKNEHAAEIKVKDAKIQVLEAGTESRN